MRKAYLLLLTGVLVLPLLTVLAACGSSAVAPLAAKGRFRVATTTSLYDTGLWGYLEPKFEKKYNVEMDILYAGTGKAIEYGTRGDVDAIAVHDKKAEEKFIAEGYGVERVPFAYNYFLIVGPAADPAGIKGLSPEDAFKKLMETGKGTFVSRGDNSGTHSKEKAIWTAAGFSYANVEKTGAWYVEAGLGMGQTLQMANEKQGYTLTDMGTYLTYKSKLGLVPIVDKGSILLNVYSVIICKNGVQPTIAQNLVNFLRADDTQGLIAEFGVSDYGEPLFYPWDPEICGLP